MSISFSPARSSFDSRTWRFSSGKTTREYHRRWSLPMRVAVRSCIRRPRSPNLPSGRPHERLAHSELNLLKRVLIVRSGGVFGNGYVYAERTVDPHDCYFACHFRMDPVMPGSLGVEAMLQALQAFALQTGLTRS